MRPPSVQDWMATLPASVVAGKGAESQLTAGQIFAAMSHQRFAGSLDSTKPNAMTPWFFRAWQRFSWRVASRLGEDHCLHAGAPTPMGWDRHTHASPLAAGHCVPRGCASLALAVWMAAGVKATTVPSEPVLTKVYMDDRTFVSSDPHFLVNQINRWESWSARVGLQESRGPKPNWRLPLLVAQVGVCRAWFDPLLWNIGTLCSGFPTNRVR